MNISTVIPDRIISIFTRPFDFNFDGKRALIIATNHGVLNKPGELGGKKTGVFLSELSVPYFHFSEAGICMAAIQIF